MVMTSAPNLTQQQLVTQLVPGQTVQTTIVTNSVGTTTITPGQVRKHIYGLKFFF